VIRSPSAKLINSKILKKHQMETHPVNKLNAIAPSVFRRRQLRTAARPDIKVAIAGSTAKKTLDDISLSNSPDTFSAEK
jgi:hypothetical protein